MANVFNLISKWPNYISGNKITPKSKISNFSKIKKNSLASYSRSLREQGLVDSAVDLDDFEQDFGKPKTTSGYGGEGSATTKKTKKGFLRQKIYYFITKSTLYYSIIFLLLVFRVIYMYTNLYFAMTNDICTIFFSYCNL